MQQGLNLLAALLILIVGWWLSACAAGAVRRIFERSGIDVTLRPMLASATQWIVRVLTLVLVLSQFGVQTASIIAMLGAAGLAIGRRCRARCRTSPPASCWCCCGPSAWPVHRRPGVAGTVRETGLFMTELTTADGVCLRVPNGKLWGSAITNYSENPTRRLDIEATVAFGSDLQAALAALRAMLAAEPRLLAEPRAEAMVINYAPQGITLNVRCWTASADYWGVRFDFYGRIEATLAAAGYPLALPLQELRMPAGAGPLAGAADPGQARLRHAEHGAVAAGLCRPAGTATRHPRTLLLLHLPGQVPRRAAPLSFISRFPFPRRFAKGLLNLPASRHPRHPRFSRHRYSPRRLIRRCLPALLALAGAAHAQSGLTLYGFVDAGLFKTGPGSEARLGTIQRSYVGLRGREASARAGPPRST